MDTWLLDDKKLYNRETCADSAKEADAWCETVGTRAYFVAATGILSNLYFHETPPMDFSNMD